jgi:hypothetical protein
MDICKHHNLLADHGAFTGSNAILGRLEPFFSLSKTAAHSDVLICPMDFWVANATHVAWEDKTDDRLMWRGGTTGGDYHADTDWARQHRFRLAEIGGSEEDVDVIDPKASQTLSESIKSVNPSEWLDIGFVGEPSREFQVVMLY